MVDERWHVQARWRAAPFSCAAAAPESAMAAVCRFPPLKVACFLSSDRSGDIVILVSVLEKLKVAPKSSYPVMQR